MENNLVDVFNRLKIILQKYEGLLKPKFDLDSKYDLWSFKDIEIAGRKREEVYFAGLIIQSDYVGLYYMPVYTDPAIGDIFDPELLKHLKGKSCFHIKSLDPALEKQIEKALEIGFQLYKKKGWI